MKVLRPLRALSRNEGLKLSINALRVALPEVSQITLLSFLFYFIFGVIAINYFEGKFFDCDISDNFKVHNKWDCLNSGGHWTNNFLNFDSTPNAIATFFIMSNTVEWASVMYRAAKAISDPDYINTNNFENPYASLFFVIFLVIGNFFLMNMYIGVIITKYNREKELAGKDFMLTEQ